MNAFSKFDLREVARLTRAGKLTDAVRRLQRRDAPPAGAAPDASDASLMDRLRQLAPLTRGGFAGLGGLALEPHNAPATSEGTGFETRLFSGARGPRSYKLFVPAGLAKNAPMVVMLHGCTQDPDDFARGTRMNEVAQAQKFLVVYPCQPQSANLQKCWNWFDAREQSRDGGEPSDIVGVVREVLAAFSGDPRRVYVAGLSAGGAAAANLAATYPDIFAAIGVHSGLACGAARDMGSAFAAMRSGAPNLRPNGARVPAIVFHGDADRTVSPVNAAQVMAQAEPQAGLTETAAQGRTPAGMDFTRHRYADTQGLVVGERWTLHGAGHAWSGGSPEGSYTEPRGPDASHEMARFFLSHRRG